MKLITAVLAIPFRLLFSMIIFIFIVIIGLVSAIVLSIQYRTPYRFVRYFKIVSEGFRDMLVFPVWPLIKIFRR